MIGKVYNVLFWGNWTSLHGLEVVAKAIIQLKDNKRIRFTLIGSHDKQGIRKTAEQELKNSRARNYIFLDNMDLNVLAEYIRNCDLALTGSFASTPQGDIDLRNATFQGMASGVPILVPDIKVYRELLTDVENCFMCKIDDSNSLARTILKAFGLKQDKT